MPSGLTGAVQLSRHGHRDLVVNCAACAVLTVSDTRSAADDTSGARIRTLLGAAGHTVARYRIVPDDPKVVADVVAELLGDAGIDAVILNGGTGLAPRDTTFEAVRGLLDKEIPGFGEIFRHLSYVDVGPAAMLSRATAGVARGKIVVSMPGAPAAVELAMTKLVLPELGHMIFLARGRPG